MTKTRNTSRPIEPPPPTPPSRRTPVRRATAERKLRILERLTAGASVADVARMEDLTARRVRQIIAEMLASRAVDPPAGFVPLQIARLGDALQVAHAMMMEGDLQALDRVVKLVGELDRYHGFGRAEIAAAPAPEAREAEIFRPATR
jgi:transposase-like protein